MGRQLPLTVLFSESVTLLGRVVRVYGEEVVTGFTADGSSRAEVAGKLNRLVGDYLREQRHENEQEY